MGEPATPTPAERDERRNLAAAIVASVLNDEAMPHGLRVIKTIGGDILERVDVEQLLFHLAQEIDLLIADGKVAAKTHELACKLQDADQCEDHSTGDDCDQGTIEHELFEHLARARTDEEPDRTDSVERGDKKRGPAVASDLEHVLNELDECVSWCPACRENTSRGLNPDGTKKERT